jgi:hypothetical protein
MFGGVVFQSSDSSLDMVCYVALTHTSAVGPISAHSGNGKGLRRMRPSSGLGAAPSSDWWGVGYACFRFGERRFTPLAFSSLELPNPRSKDVLSNDEVEPTSC